MLRRESTTMKTTGRLSTVAQRRLMKELDEWTRGSPVPCMKVIKCDQLDELRDVQFLPLVDKWLVDLVGADNSLYHNEHYVLRFKFPEDYPMAPPETVFLEPAPRHPHVYTNGHICLNILFDHWSPALTVTSVCLSVLSMLSSATEKDVPPDNDVYVTKSMGKSPKETRWGFHDDSV